MSITRQDLVKIAILSFVFFLVAAWNLGMRDVPMTSWQASGGESFYLDLGHPERVDSIHVLLKEADFVNFKVYTGSPSNWDGNITASMDGYYSWKKIGINRETRYLRFVFEYSCGEIAEMVVIGEGGKKISVNLISGENGDDEALKNLIDEQEKIECPPTYKSGTYFDEIYYVRTAEDYLNLEEPYDWTHPPLGKLIIAAGILIFSYNPFGWRIAGVIFATLMMPVMYVFGKRMFGTRVAAFISSFLWMFEFMQFTMGRIATVDTFAVFFSTMSSLFFFTYFQGVIQKKKASIRTLFLAVLFFALGFSTKWYVLYGFIGQVFLLVVLRLRELLTFSGRWTGRVKEFFRYPFLPMIGFIAVAAVIYVLTFIPYMMVGHTLRDVYEMQWTMYNYHSQLTATHPFSSPWWSWPLIIKPVWLYVSYLPDGLVSTIASMGNPAIWWVGAILLFFAVAKIIKEGDFVCLFIVTIFLFQWLPYVFISRCVFLYHFYVSVPLLVLTVTYFLKELWKKRYGKLVVLVYLVIVAVLFVLFYPVISGYPVPYGWKEVLRWLQSWMF